MNTNIELQVLDWTRAKPLAEKIRREVFITEQNVPEIDEWDKWDSFAIHIIAIHDGQAIATGRLTREGKIGRMAVISEFRKKGVGSAILNLLLECAEDRGIKDVSLHAQTYIQHFYEKFGFKPVGDEFEEAGIPHIKMEK